mgnify:CR=1 FL=1
MAIAECLYLNVGFLSAKRLSSTIIFLQLFSYLQSRNRGQKNDSLEVGGKAPACNIKCMRLSVCRLTELVIVNTK